LADTPRLPGFEEAFREENGKLFVERARFLLWISLTLYPTFWLLDLWVAPGQALRFLLLRAAVCVIYGLGLAAVYSRRVRELAPMVVMLGAFASAAGISQMCSLLGGWESNYFAGNLIVIFVIGFFIPWQMPAIGLLCALITLTYMGVNLAGHGPSREMVAPLFFLAGASVFTYLAGVSSRRTRRRDLSLRLRFEKANEELKELDEAKSRFFANVSHELRTPLTLLLGPLATLTAAEEDPERAVILDSMAANARRLLRQVDALLQGAKLESGLLRLELQPGNLGDLVAELAGAAAPHAAGRGIRLTTAGLEELPDSLFDPEKTEIIAANLISNAVKFTPEKGHIAVRGETGASSIAFEVEDDGPGIPADQLEKIFERFHQVDGSLSRGQGGAGLGLALARDLARLHGGEVTVRNRPEGGAVFRVELPRDAETPPERRRRPRRREDQFARMRAEALAARDLAAQTRRETLLADVEPPRLSAAALPRAAAPANAPRILLVEDNDDLRAFVAHRLAGAYRVETAADGEAGLAAARRVAPDLVVADVMMPGLDGYELCRRLRADPALAAVPVILVTAKAGSEAVVEGLAVGADDYVVKPFSLPELEARIAAHLRAKETERHLHERESRLAAIGQMTSALVHDLRNPLTMLRGYADLAHALAVRGGDALVIASELEQVRAAADRLRQMIEEVLDFARGGSPTLALETVAVRPYLEKSLPHLALDLEERGIATVIELDLDSSVRVRLDRDRFPRILENLLRNAREAVLAGGREKRVWVRIHCEEGHLDLRVADTGPGIPEDAVEHLFEPFATGKKQGTGLGLVTVRNLVKAHGGDIHVEPHAPEGGAAFVVTLPLVGDSYAAMPILAPATRAK
jgi:signal transduction histidine kinase